MSCDVCAGLLLFVLAFLFCFVLLKQEYLLSYLNRKLNATHFEAFVLCFFSSFSLIYSVNERFCFVCLLWKCLNECVFVCGSVYFIACVCLCDFLSFLIIRFVLVFTGLSKISFLLFLVSIRRIVMVFKHSYLHLYLAYLFFAFLSDFLRNFYIKKPRLCGFTFLFFLFWFSYVN